jgi:predicted transcriptional regulator
MKGESNKMKITKAQLKQLIKEELQVVLTNEEAGEMFGLEVQKELEEGSRQKADIQRDKLKAMKKERDNMDPGPKRDKLDKDIKAMSSNLEEAEDLDLSGMDDKVADVLDTEAETQAIDREASLAALQAGLQSAELGKLQHTPEAAKAVVTTYREMLANEKMSDQQLQGILAVYDITQ